MLDHPMLVYKILYSWQKLLRLGKTHFHLLPFDCIIIDIGCILVILSIQLS